MKTYLILINNAPKMALYHKGLGDRLREKGHKVVYAITDRMAVKTAGLSFESENCYYFSEYFRNNETKIISDEKYKHLNIWKTFYSDYDRNIFHYHFTSFDHAYYYSLLNNLVCFFDEIIRSSNVDFIIYENISNSFAYVAFEIGRINNVGYRGYVGSRLPNRFELHTEEYGIKERFRKVFEENNSNTLSSEEEQSLDTYLSKYNGTEIPSYHSKTNKLSADYSFIKRYFNKEKYDQIKAGVSEYFKSSEKKYNYQIINPLQVLFVLFKRQMIKKVRTIIGKKYFDRIGNDKYYLFPLHMKPESSTSVLARHFCDDLAVIKNIAFNLPFGTMLYVKEHFVNFGNLPLAFYNDLKKIPNVKLIDSNANTMTLVRNCEALITLTSTMGLEALLMNKNVVLFGDVFYECHPNCRKLNNFEDLHSVLVHLKQTESNYDLSKRFVRAYQQVTYEGHVGYPIYEKEDVEKFSNYFIKALESYDGAN